MTNLTMTFLPQPMERALAVEFCSQMFGFDRVFPAQRSGNELRSRLPDGTKLGTFLADEFFSGEKDVHIGLGISANQISEWKARLKRVLWTPENAGTPIQSYWPFQLTMTVPAASARFVDHYHEIAGAAGVGHAVLTQLDFAPEPYSETALSAQVSARWARPIAEHLPPQTIPGPWRGLGGIAWRTLLGREFVEMFGVERLRTLPAGLAIEHDNGLWTLQRCERPEDSLSEESAENERSIIDHLGPEHFVNVQTNSLPTVVPNFPPELVPHETPPATNT